jgi:hypothetical protein
VYGTVRTVVWEDGGGDSASYPIIQREHKEQQWHLINRMDSSGTISNYGLRIINESIIVW